MKLQCYSEDFFFAFSYFPISIGNTCICESRNKQVTRGPNRLALSQSIRPKHGHKNIEKNNKTKCTSRVDLLGCFEQTNKVVI